MDNECGEAVGVHGCGGIWSAGGLETDKTILIVDRACQDHGIIGLTTSHSCEKSVSGE